MKLSATRVRALRDPGRYSDGDGLHLFIHKNGRKSWVQRITVDSRRRDIGLGGYPTVSLAQARKRASDNREAIGNGRDPVADKRRSATHVQRGRPCCPRSKQASLAQREPHVSVDSDPRTTRLPQDR